MKHSLFFSIVLVFLSISSFATSKRESECKALQHCIDAKAWCGFYQFPRKGEKQIIQSEAYGDMVDRFTSLQKQNPDVHFFTVKFDLSEIMKGLGKTNKDRTVFVGKGGEALEVSGLYVDDPAPIDVFFKSSSEKKISPLTNSTQGILKIQIGKICQ